MAHKVCPNCGVSQPQDYIFCAECGSRLPELLEESQAAIRTDMPQAEFDPEEFSTLPRSRTDADQIPAWAQNATPVAPPARKPPPSAPTPQPAPAHAKATGTAWVLVHLSRAGGTNVPYPVPASGLTVGTSGCTVNFPDDRTMSPRHAAFTPIDDGLQAEDAGSVNGVFLRISGSHKLSDGDVFVCGDSVFRFSSETANIARDDFMLYAAPDETCPRGTLTKLLAGGADGPVFPVSTKPVVIGREQADIACPEDRYMSRVHAAIEPESGGLFLKDKQSRNGTYIKTSGVITAHENDVILVGRQLLRVEASNQ